ncbi:hypothetical protein PRIPAC_78097 [Pristionchus pacificus]|uniref:Uncharacterized protein n=1 Tax=Pristionchus pacificus TaxID=54126 RepID=A0A2A6CJW8_PRIPA|nr:hypothetical protein PRIPAC_78097 [Pristionchus pacificus]|eukprot:PDM78377.1 hypothetical protein PRIPAC_30956 [Pristionchus pacificus]
MEQGATAVVQSINGACTTDYSGKFIQSWSGAEITCGPCRDSSVVCIAGMWFYNVTVTGSSVPGQIDSYQLSNGTCYTASACPDCS